MDGVSTRAWRRFRNGLLDIYKRDGRTTCEVRQPGCTNTVETIDHITPRSLGGAVFDPNNCRPSCAHCNYSRGNGTRTTPTVRAPTRQSRAW